jgi:DNA-damage-inducible protein D
MADEHGDPTTGGELALFDEETAEKQIRRTWHEGRWFFSVIDVIALLTGAQIPRNYWSDLKRRLAQDEGFVELHAKIVQLRMTATDGKQRLTDAADTETLLRLIQSIPSPKAEPFKQWLARVGTERLAEVENPELAADRMRRTYLAQGYSEEWVNARLQGIMVRDELTTEWRERGAEEGREFAILTDILHRGAFDVTTAEHKAIKHLRTRHNLRDSMTTLELALTILAEATSTALHQAHDSQGFGELQSDTREAGDVAGTARRDIEARTGQPVVSAENFKTLTERDRQPSLFGVADDAGSRGSTSNG